MGTTKPAMGQKRIPTTRSKHMAALGASFGPPSDSP